MLVPPADRDASARTARNADAALLGIQSRRRKARRPRLSSIPCPAPQTTDRIAPSTPEKALRVPPPSCAQKLFETVARKDQAQQSLPESPFSNLHSTPNISFGARNHHVSRRRRTRRAAHLHKTVSRERASRRAMPCTLQDPKVCMPRTHRRVILMRHHSRDLVHVSQIMHGPRRQQLRHRDSAERRVPSTPLEILFPQIHRTQFSQALRSQAYKLIQQLSQRFACALTLLSPTVERLEPPRLAKLQYHPSPRHPIRAFAMIQMPHDIERAPRALTFIAQRPRFRQITQQRIERSRRAGEQRYGVLQVLFHDGLRFVPAI